jgi:hypothetical protein
MRKAVYQTDTLLETYLHMCFILRPDPWLGRNDRKGGFSEKDVTPCLKDITPCSLGRNWTSTEGIDLGSLECSAFWLQVHAIDNHRIERAEQLRHRKEKYAPFSTKKPKDITPCSVTSEHTFLRRVLSRLSDIISYQQSNKSNSTSGRVAVVTVSSEL